MKILHIAYLQNNKLNGVNTVVPLHISSQEKYVDVALMNICSESIDGIQHQFLYKKDKLIDFFDKTYPNIDIVIFHEIYHKEYLEISKILVKKNIKYIIVPHGSLTKTAQKKKYLKKIIANYFFFNRFINCSNGIQCLSLNEYSSVNIKKNKFIGTNGSNIPQLFKTSFNKNRIKFLYIGRLEVYVKGIDLLIRAISSIKPIFIENKCTLNIYGPDVRGRFRKVKNLIDKYNVSDVVFLNHEIIGEDKEKTLLESDVFIQTSRTEGMPLGVLEALSYGLPVIITEGTGVAKQVLCNNCGWTSKNHYTSISQAIIKMIQEKSHLIEKSKNARKFIFDNFDWDIITKKNLFEYQRIIKDTQ